MSRTAIADRYRTLATRRGRNDWGGGEQVERHRDARVAGELYVGVVVSRVEEDVDVGAAGVAHEHYCVQRHREVTLPRFWPEHRSGPKVPLEEYLAGRQTLAMGPCPRNRLQP